MAMDVRGTVTTELQPEPGARNILSSAGIGVCFSSFLARDWLRHKTSGIVWIFYAGP